LRAPALEPPPKYPFSYSAAREGEKGPRPKMVGWP
jgi:hypothetical protein